MSLEDIVKSLELSTQQFHEDMKAIRQETKVGSQDLGNQPSQLATSVSQLEIQTSKELKSQTDANPIENVSSITPQSGTELHMVEQAPMETKEDEETLEDTEAQDKKDVQIKGDEKEILNTSLKVKIDTPVLELKTLPYHLQCLYLGVSEILSIIISQGLFKEQYELKLNEKEALKNCKLSSWFGRFESVNIFSHGVAKLKSLVMRQILKVNDHRSKLSLGGDKVTTIIGIALASLQQLTH
ncbi:UNVERIFIED_CONTAM: hypothetical protein Slati_1769000 [Sesamum latifolium]|uniref:Uncharacterized protein n=1 Tax=Sesamum latifolium TaxID=2727402 RepID=A0AAW2X2Y9_9LAMI